MFLEQGNQIIVTKRLNVPNRTGVANGKSIQVTDLKIRRGVDMLTGVQWN